MGWNVYVNDPSRDTSGPEWMKITYWNIQMGWNGRQNSISVDADGPKWGQEWHVGIYGWAGMGM